MSLSASAMATAMATQIKAIAGINISNQTELNNFCLAIATAIVAQIQSSAVVPAGIAVQVSVSTGAGVTTGAGTVT